MGLPNVLISFKSKALSAFTQGAVGIVALVLKDSSVAVLTEYKISETGDIPGGLSAGNQKYINDALLGKPKQIKAIVIPAAAADYTEAETYLETIKWNVGAIPGIIAGETAGVATWAKDLRDTKLKKVLFVLPNTAGDHEGIINFATDNIKVGSDTYTASDYTARIAGIIGGLALTIAPTFQVLAEVDDVPHLTKAEADTAVDAGKLILYHDGEKVKIARGVTSLVTTTADKGADWKKIKLVRILDLIYTDVKSTIEDHYVGQVQNSYAQKLLLISAINAYFGTLEDEQVLDVDANTCDINLIAQKAYLVSIGVDVTALTDQQIKEYNTHDKVFLTSNVRPLDAIEDVQIEVNL